MENLTKDGRAALETRRLTLINLILDMEPEDFRVFMTTQHEGTESCLFCGRDWSLGPAVEIFPPGALDDVPVANDPPYSVRRDALEIRRQALIVQTNRQPHKFRALMTDLESTTEFCWMCGRDWAKGPAEVRLPPEVLRLGGVVQTAD